MTIPFNRRRVKTLLDALKPARLTRIVDIGANPINDCPYSALLKIGGCEVVGFEPQPKALQELQDSKGPNETYLPYAVGSGGTSSLNVMFQSGFTSLLEPNADTIKYLGRFSRGMRVVEKVDIETKRLDDIEELPDFDLLKIDIQGGEQDVFRNGNNKLSSALAVITEVAAIPLYKDQPLLDTQMSSLGALGFSLHKFLFLESVRVRNSVADLLAPRFSRSQLTDGDAVFVRNLLVLHDQSDEQLKHLAVLADAVFGSFDLAGHCLSILIDRDAIKKDDVDAYIASVNTQLSNLEAAQ